MLENSNASSETNRSPYPLQNAAWCNILDALTTVWDGIDSSIDLIVIVYLGPR